MSSLMSRRADPIGASARAVEQWAFFDRGQVPQGKCWRNFPAWIPTAVDWQSFAKLWKSQSGNTPYGPTVWPRRDAKLSVLCQSGER